MAFIWWRLGQLMTDRPLPTPRGGVAQGPWVWDVDAVGWDLGIRPGMALVEMKWRYPGSVWLPWNPDAYQKTRTALREWIARRAAAAAWDQGGAGIGGWWEWPRLDGRQYEGLVGEVVPRLAGRLEGGVAPLPELARWAMEEGGRLGLPCWAGAGHRTYVVTPAAQAQWLPRLPLRYVEASALQRKAWREQGWRAAGEVPGLLARLLRGRQQAEQGGNAVEPGAWAGCWRFPCEGVAGNGWLRLVETASCQVAEHLSRQGQGFRRLRLTWWNEEGKSVRRDRRWPVAAGDRRTVYARLAAEMGKGLPWPPVLLQVEVGECERVDQLRWEFATAGELPAAWPGVRRGIATSRRTQLLQEWDVWLWGDGNAAVDGGGRRWAGTAAVSLAGCAVAGGGGVGELARGGGMVAGRAGAVVLAGANPAAGHL